MNPPFSRSKARLALVFGLILAGLVLPDKAADAQTSKPRGKMVLERVGAIGGEIKAAFAHDHLIIVGQCDTLRIFDFTNPSQPLEMGALWLENEINSMVLNWPALYLSLENYGSSYATGRCIDLTDPMHPRLLDHVILGSDKFFLLTIEKGVLWAKDRPYDISKPLAPRKLAIELNEGGSDDNYPGKINLPQSLTPLNDLAETDCVKIRNQRAYVIDNQSGLVVVNISDPAKPRITGRQELPVDPTRRTRSHLLFAGNLAFVDLISVDATVAPIALAIDVENPDAPKMIGPLTPDDKRQAIKKKAQAGELRQKRLQGKYRIEVEGGDFPLGEDSKIKIVDTSQAKSSVVAEIKPEGDLSGFVEDYVIDRNYLYITEWFHDSEFTRTTLDVFDLTNPRAPVLVGNYSELPSFSGLGVENNIVCVATGHGGLVILRCNQGQAKPKGNP